MGLWKNQLSGPTNPVTDSGWGPQHTRKGFFTDTSICIGCKACEVACKEWNRVPVRTAAEHGTQLLGSSYDNSGHLGANTWRHVAFIEQGPQQQARAKESGRAVMLGMPGVRTVADPSTSPGSIPAHDPVEAPATGGSSPRGVDGDAQPACCEPASSDDPARRAGGSGGSSPRGVEPVRWLMSSDVCKHCTHAGCLDVCPTGALFRSEFGTVVVQADVCNGCGYCVASCPFGVIGKREDGLVEVAPGVEEKVHHGGIAQKCTLCYDRLREGQRPACAQTCPTTSISFGDHDDMVAKARARLRSLHQQGHTEARLYGANPDDGVGGTGSVFLLMDEPEAYGLPPDPVVTTKDLPRMFTMAGMAGTAMIGLALAVFAGNGRPQ